jgi:molybdenum cofactor cytidylyltransferase
VRSPSYAGVVLAAGASSRMGRDKALLSFAGTTFLAGAIALLQSACDLVIVVAGANAETVRPVVYENAAFLVENPRPELGQFSSLRIGLRAVLDRGRDTACITLVDRPPAAPSTLATLRATLEPSDPHEVWAAVPEYEGRHGHPVIFAREMLEAMLLAPATSTARDVEHANQSRVMYVPVADPRIAININTPEEYASLCSSR